MAIMLNVSLQMGKEILVSKVHSSNADPNAFDHLVFRGEVDENPRMSIVTYETLDHATTAHTDLLTVADAAGYTVMGFPNNVHISEGVNYPKISEIQTKEISLQQAIGMTENDDVIAQETHNGVYGFVRIGYSNNHLAPFSAITGAYMLRDDVKKIVSDIVSQNGNSCYIIGEMHSDGALSLMSMVSTTPISAKEVARSAEQEILLTKRYAPWAAGPVTSNEFGTKKFEKQAMLRNSLKNGTNLIFRNKSESSLGTSFLNGVSEFYGGKQDV